MSNSTSDLREEIGKRAAVFAVPGVLSVLAESGYRRSRSDPNSFEDTLFGPTVPSQAGDSVLRALHASRLISAEEIPTFFTDSNDLGFGDWVQRFTKAAGSRTSQNVPPNTAHCAVASRYGKVFVSPTRKRRGTAWEGLGPDTEIIVLDPNPQAIGEAVFAALGLCVPSVRIGT